MSQTPEPKPTAVYSHPKMPGVLLVHCEGDRWYRVPKKYRGWDARERLHGEPDMPWMLVRTHSPPPGVMIPLRGRTVPEHGTTLTDRMIAAREKKGAAVKSAEDEV